MSQERDQEPGTLILLLLQLLWLLKYAALGGFGPS